MTHPTAETTAVWIALNAARDSLLSDIESDLKSQGLPSLGWYDVLWEIEKAGPSGIRPFELKDKLLLPQYALSRLLERMVRAGLIVRENVRNDGRGQSVSLSQKGSEVRHAMWPVYSRMLVQSVEHRLLPGEAKELARLLGKITAPQDTSSPQ